jgi:hypothetical protein
MKHHYSNQLLTSGLTRRTVWSRRATAASSILQNQMGSLAGAAHLSKDNAGVLR